MTTTTTTTLRTFDNGDGGDGDGDREGGESGKDSELKGRLCNTCPGFFPPDWAAPPNPTCSDSSTLLSPITSYILCIYVHVSTRISNLMKKRKKKYMYPIYIIIRK